MSKQTKKITGLMQLGRRKKYLNDCIIAADLINQYETDETIRKRVFESKIKPVLCCSYATFNRMLNEVNPLKQISEIEDQILIIKNN
jgi:hypothetical protein